MSYKLKKLVSLILISVIVLIAISGVNAEDISNVTATVDLIDNSNEEFIPQDTIVVNTNDNVLNISGNVSFGVVIAGNTAGIINGGNSAGDIIFKNNTANNNADVFYYGSDGVIVKFDSNFFPISNEIGGPSFDFDVDAIIRKSNSSNINVNYSFYQNNISGVNMTILFGVGVSINIFKWNIGLNFTFKFKYSSVNITDVNLFDSNFLNIVGYDNKVIYANQSDKYTVFDSQYLTEIIYRNTTKEIINSAITVYESNFARNSLLRITNESVVDNKVGIFDFSLNSVYKVNSTLSKINISLFGHEILSESLEMLANGQFTINFEVIDKDLVNYCLIISKNNIEFYMAIDDSLVICEDLL